MTRGYKKGKKLSEEHKRKIGLARKGRKHSEETKRKINYWKGRHLSEEHKRNVSIAKRGEKRSEEFKYNRSRIMKGNGNSNWKGGRFTRLQGYAFRYFPEHHRSNTGHVLEHILVYEQYYKCCILRYAHIHHKNGIKDDNRVENLQLMSHSEHSKLEWQIRKAKLSH